MRSLMAFAATAIGLALATPALAQNAAVYGGGQAGYSWANSDVAIPEYPSRFNMKSNGASAGVFAGVSWRLSENWSAGLEADDNWSDENGRHLSGASGERYLIQQRWTANARVRVAYDVSEHTQVYGAAGAAWSNLEVRYIPPAGDTDTQTVQGWTAGVGIQRDNNDSVFTRAEVRYANYDIGRFFHNGPSTVQMESTSLLLGVGYRFGRRATPPSTPPPV